MEYLFNIRIFMSLDFPSFPNEVLSCILFLETGFLCTRGWRILRTAIVRPVALSSSRNPLGMGKVVRLCLWVTLWEGSFWGISWINVSSFHSFRYAKTFSQNQPDSEIALHPASVILAPVECFCWFVLSCCKCLVLRNLISYRVQGCYFLCWSLFYDVSALSTW